MLGPNVSLEEGWLKNEVNEASPLIYRLGGPHTDRKPRSWIRTVGQCIIQRPGWMRRLIDCYTAVDHPSRLPDSSRLCERQSTAVVDCHIDCKAAVDLADDRHIDCNIAVDVAVDCHVDC